MSFRDFLSLRRVRYGIAVLSVLAITFSLQPFRVTLSTTTIALALLLVVLFSATFFGRNPALLSSFVAMLCFNYFFLPPLHTWTIAESQNLIAWAAFTITAVIAGELSAYARRRAREAERLYEELQNAFETASQAEAARRSEKLKSALLDAVTHDLRTPLTSIKASVTMLLEETSDEAIHVTLEREGRQELLEVINEETDRLNDFVESMVEVAKLEAGSANLRKTNEEVSEIIHQSLQRAESLLANHRVKINLSKKLQPVLVDRKSISEAIYNLIENAVKYSPANSEIEIEAKIVADELRIIVEDEGAGIPVEEREKIFQKFYRADKKTKGFGMGLAIVRGIIEAHNGEIRVEDGKNGARFVINLPIKANE
jgi:two-component system sensor histidine kinase KdpD